MPTSVLPFAILGHANVYIGHYILQPGQPIPYYVRLFHGHYLSSSPIGAAITATPVYILYVFLGGALNLASAAILGKLSASAIAALSVYLIGIFLNKIGITKYVFFAILYGLGTETFAISSQGLWQHGAATLWLILFLIATWDVIKDNRKYAEYWGGAFAGMVVASRPDDFLIIVPFIIWMTLNKQLRMRLVGVAATFIPIVALNMEYNAYFFGSYFSTGYGNISHVYAMFSFPLILGLAGNLFSPSKGWLVFAPWSLSIIGLFHKKYTKTIKYYFILALCAGVFLGLVLIAKFYQWPGGYSYGPRYMTDFTPSIIILSGIVIDPWLSRRSAKVKNINIYIRIVLVLAFAWSFAIQFLGAYVISGGAWNAAAHPNTFLRPLFSVEDSMPLYYLKTLLHLHNYEPKIENPQIVFKSLVLLEKPFIFKPGKVVSNKRYAILMPNSIYHGVAVIKNIGRDKLIAFPGEKGVVVHFAYKIFKGENEVVSSGIRSALLHNIASGRREKVYFEFATPSSPGDYSVMFTLVQENTEWFQDRLDNYNAYIMNISIS